MPLVLLLMKSGPAMLMYISGNTRPDMIAYAVHKAAGFTHGVLKSHAAGFKRSKRYLKKTENDG